MRTSKPHRCGTGLACLLLICKLTASSLGQDTNVFLFPFPMNGKWGYTNTSGRVIIVPKFLMVSDRWDEGFAWVEIAGCECDDLATAGDFIDTNGVRLVGQHIHAIVDEPWPLGWLPRFQHGLAFIRSTSNNIFCISTNGLPIDGHREWGPFVPYHYGVAHYNFERGHALVRVKKGGYGLLTTDGQMVGVPTNDWNSAWYKWLHSQRSGTEER